MSCHVGIDICVCVAEQQRRRSPGLRSDEERGFIEESISSIVIKSEVGSWPRIMPRGRGMSKRRISLPKEEEISLNCYM